MGDRTCSERGCSGKLYSRGLCAKCYGKAWRSGSLQLLLFTGDGSADQHRLTKISREEKTAICSICGPVRIHVQGKKYPRCMTARREEDARYRAAHPERNRGKVRKSGPKRKLSPEEARLERLRYNFRLSGDDYQRMFENQDGACAICGQRSERRLHVDHDHACCPGDRSCGKCVRGLLCGACNAALGFMRDDPERFKAAIDYLTAYAAARPPLAS